MLLYTRVCARAPRPVMTHKASIVLIAIGAATMLGTELVRSLVHRRRARRGGGGTQDVARWGTFLSLACFVAAALCWLL